MKKIIKHRLRYHPNRNLGEIDILLEDGQSAKVPIESAQEFLIVMTMLETGVSQIEPDGSITVNRF